MKRDIDALSQKEFDVLIIGAGIYGATLAWDATLRGLSVALIDKNDFGAATSANSLKIIHGGLRYLQQLDIKRMRESIRERRIFMHIAPHLVHPLSCLMPTYGHLMKGPEVMTAGMLMNDIISFDRNNHMDKQKHLSMGKVVSRKRCLELAPGLDRTGINGGALWTDAQVYNSERLLLSFILSAAQEGAVAANYVKASSFIQKGQRIGGVQAVDSLNGDSLGIHAKVTVNTSGGWVNQILNRLDNQTQRVNLSTAMNLVVNRKLLQDTALGFNGYFTYPLENGKSYSGRHVLFMAPWRESTLIGTYHRPYAGNLDEMHVTESDIQSFLEEINKGYPNDPVQRDEVSYFYKGFLPMNGIHHKTGEVNLTKHYTIYNHQKDGWLDLLSVVGVKYTTARDVAVKTSNMIFKKLGQKAPKSTSHTRRLTGGEMDSFETLLNEAFSLYNNKLSRSSVNHLVRNFGSNYMKILDYSRENKVWMEAIEGNSEVLQAEVIHAVRQEMACKLSDVVLRRTDLGSAGHPGKEALEDCAKIMAKELGWSKNQVKKELEETESCYNVKS